MQEEIRKIIGQRFREFRKQLGVSQEFVAGDFCSPQTVSHLENGRSIPGAEIMKELAKQLGVPLREIMGAEQQEFKIDDQITLVHVYIETRDFEQALQMTEELLAKEELLEYQKNELVVCQAESLIRSGAWREGIAILSPFLEQQGVNQKIDDEALCDAYNKLGYAFFKLREFEKAFAAYERGYLITFRLSSFGVVAARVTKNLGLACNQLNMKDEAQYYLEKALGFYQSVSDIRSLADTFFALTYASNDPAYATKAQVLYESLNFVREAHIVKQHYAFHFSSKHDFHQSIQVLHSTALELAKINDYGSALFTFSRALLVCLDHYDMDQAKKYFNLATDQIALIEQEETFDLACYYRAVAKYHLLEKDYKECLHHSQFSANMYARMEMYAESAHSLKIAADAYKQQGMLSSANDILEKIYNLLSQSRRGNSE